MALRHALLAALLEGEASGYQLAKRFDVSVANFWSATPQQLYRELDRVEAEGLVHARLVRQQRRPDKRVFTLTDAGRAELHRYTAAAAKPVDVGDAPAVTKELMARLERARAKLATYDRLLADMLDGRDEDAFTRDSDRIGPYLTLMGGRMYEQTNIKWCTAALEVLSTERRSGTSR
jgi:DNA-binding PadR family transcriptional regulator